MMCCAVWVAAASQPSSICHRWVGGWVAMGSHRIVGGMQGRQGAAVRALPFSSMDPPLRMQPAPSLAPALLLPRLPASLSADEIDSILSERSSSEHEASRRLKTEFLVQVGPQALPGSAGSFCHTTILSIANRSCSQNSLPLPRPAPICPSLPRPAQPRAV